MPQNESGFSEIFTHFVRQWDGTSEDTSCIKQAIHVTLQSLFMQKISEIKYDNIYHKNLCDKTS